MRLMLTLSVAALGSFRASLGDQTLSHFRTKSVQALLVYLLVEGRVQSREWLTELIWPGLTSASGRKNLRQTLYELRQLIPEVAARDGGAMPLLLADRQTIQLNPAAAVELDTEIFARHLEQETVEGLAAGVALYRGDFLSDFYLPDSAEFEAWVTSRQAMYRRQVLGALEKLTDHHLEGGRYDRAEQYARQQLALDDLREQAIRQLMRALVAQGQRSAALRAFEDARRRLDEELQVAPGNETVLLRDQIEAEQPLDLPPTPAGVPAHAPAAAHNLSQPATTFVGRQNELASLKALLSGDGRERLITLVGLGGSGKTRLAVETALKLAATMPERFPDGIWFVSLAALSEPERVVTETAKVLNLFFAGEGLEPRQQLLDYLRPRRLLLILDNYEHLLTGSDPPLVAGILSAAPKVKVLATSRIRLNVRGEQLFPLRGLAVPEPRASLARAAANEAVMLFEQFGRQVQPDFALDEATLAAVIRICLLVEGLPLAIEMAASWLAALSAEAIAAEITRSLDILAAEWPDIPARQRSLRAVFDSSWQMLAAEERRVLKRLAVFRGSFEREAAGAVAGISLPVLLSLVHKSWLMRAGDDRYQMHGLLRQYAREALRNEPETWDEAREAHARYFSTCLARRNEALRGAGQKAALDAVATDFEDVRAAWGWLVSRRDFAALTQEMLPALVLFCGARSREKDLLALVQQARAARPGQQEAEALLLAAEAAFARGRYAIRYFQAQFVSLAQPIDLIERAWRYLRHLDAGTVDGLWLVLAATMHAWVAEQQQSQQVEGRVTRQRLREWLIAFGEQGDWWAEAFAMENLGRLLSMSGRMRPAKAEEAQNSLAVVDTQRLLTRAAAGFERLGDRLEHAHTLRLLGHHLLHRDPAQAEQALQRARVLFLEADDWRAAADILWSLAQQSLWLGDHERGFTLFDEMARVHEDLGNRSSMASALSLESQEALRYSTIEHARRTRQRSLDLSREIDDQFSTAWNLWELGEIERVAREPETARRYYEAARQMFEQQGQQFGLAFYHRGLGDLALDEGHPQAALAHFARALQASRAVGHMWTTAYLLGGLGRAARALGETAAARQHLRDAVQEAQRIGHDDLTTIALVEWATLEAAEGREAQALALATFVEQYPITWREIRERAALVAADAAAALRVDQRQAARARGEALTMAEAVSRVLGDGESSEVAGSGVAARGE